MIEFVQYWVIVFLACLGVVDICFEIVNLITKISKRKGGAEMSRKQDYADDKGLYLVCLRCKKPMNYAIPIHLYEKMGYTKSSYCNECIEEAMKKLKGGAEE